MYLWVPHGWFRSSWPLSVVGILALFPGSPPPNFSADWMSVEFLCTSLTVFQSANLCNPWQHIPQHSLWISVPFPACSPPCVCGKWNHVLLPALSYALNVPVYQPHSQSSYHSYCYWQYEHCIASNDSCGEGRAVRRCMYPVPLIARFGTRPETNLSMDGFQFGSNICHCVGWSWR